MIHEISFVIPAYNEAQTIDRCITSIYEAIRHRHLRHCDIHTEIIVVDNASTDNTAEIAFCEGAKVVFEPRKGTCYARQAGYLAAKYKLIANIDADNFLPVTWIDAALSELDEETVLLSGPINYVEFGWFMRHLAYVFYFLGSICNKLIGPMSQGGNTILRKSALAAIGGYNTDIKFYGDDTDLAKRIAKVGKVKFSSKVWSYGSARRFMVEGPITTTFRYAINYFSVTLRKKPLHKTYSDIRLN